MPSFATTKIPCEATYPCSIPRSALTLASAGFRPGEGVIALPVCDPSEYRKYPVVVRARADRDADRPGHLAGNVGHQRLRRHAALEHGGNVAHGDAEEVRLARVDTAHDREPCQLDGNAVALGADPRHRVPHRRETVQPARHGPLRGGIERERISQH